MSLNITSTLRTPQGIEVSNAYGRVAVQNGFAGDKIEAGVSIFVSAEAFENGDQPLQLIDLQLGGTAPYEYEPGTQNILDIAHDMMIQVLADQNVTAVKDLS